MGASYVFPTDSFKRFSEDFWSKVLAKVRTNPNLVNVLKHLNKV
jgi:hypothetical protein